MRNRKIAFLGGFIDIGGAGKILKFVANACVGTFSEVAIISNGQTNRPSDIDKRIVFKSIIGPPREGLIYRWRLTREIRNCIKSMKPDVLCVFDSEHAVMARLATLGLDIKFASAERGDPYTFPWIWKVLTFFCYGISDACFFQLEGARDFFNRRVISKSFVIPNPFILPCDVSPYDGVRNKTIVSAGRFVPEKGYDLLIKAFSYVVAKHPEYELILFGEGPLFQDYRELASELGLEDKILYPGYVKNVAESVRKEGIFVLSSHYEGIPNVLIEAMSTGIPTVSTDCTPGGPSFLTNKGERGLIVPKNDVNAMAKAILYLIENKELYNQLVQKGPQIREELNPSKISQEWLASFMKIIEC